MVCWFGRKPAIVGRQSFLTIASSVYERTCCTSSLASLLRSSAHEKALRDGLGAHNRIVYLGLEQTKLLADLLVHMYGCCGHLQEAVLVFLKFPQRDCHSWNAMANAYARCGCSHRALQLFADMYNEGIAPNKFILTSTLSVCAEEADLITGMHVHYLIMWEGLDLDVPLQNAILNVYAKCSCLDDATVVFLYMDKKDEASYNSIMFGCIVSGHDHNAIILFTQMMMEGLMPNKGTFIAVVSACIEGTQIERQSMHARLAVDEYKSNVVLSNSLINMYGKCGDLKGAVNIFYGLPFCTIVSWNSLIISHAQHGRGRKSCELFDRLHQEGELPNSVTFRSLSPGFESLSLKECKQLHVRVLHKGFDVSDDATGSLINMYCKCGSCAHAFQVFERMPKRDLRAWNALGAGFVHHSIGKPSIWQFSQMLQEGVLPDKVTFLNTISGYASGTVLVEGIRLHALLAGSQMQIDIVLSSALLNMYGKCGSLENVLSVFSTMAERNEYSWASMITAFAMQGEVRQSLLMFEQMQWEGIKPDKVSILCLLCVCANQTALNFCKYVHTLVLETGLHRDAAVQNSLVTMYSKCGSLTGANMVFSKMVERNLISWTAVIAACAQHGQGKEAFSCFEEMQNEGLCPDLVTFVEILSACSRAGLIDEAYYILASMKQQHGIELTVDHLNCVVDLLSRAGRLDVAEHLIVNMPAEPNAVSWLTLLGACRSQLDLERGEHAAKWACNLSLTNASPYVTLSNLYAGSGRFDDAAYVMQEMRRLGEEGDCVGSSFKSREE
ncbi:hypothetical protein GOP47_0007907 [Adiantum capillus-veneris]|uniref:Pentatricopeptide repeat-containing protein n=1 Tax=Adiantum capillus-veneris TaxID=13818 RepID=A0A9D4ZJP2_ADICA|nr:hypothetical protein GOP47_0007907 [Adiantum capillus-veneris]